MEDNDVQLQLKKRARRRLVGAVAFVSFAAIVLPVIMDQEPRQPVQDVEIRIPGQDDKAFAPKFASAPVEPPAAKPAPESRPQPVPEPPVVEKAADKAPPKVDKVPEKSVEKPPLKEAEKVQDKPAEKPAKVEKAPEKVAEKPKGDDAKRAAAILSDKPAATPAAKSGEQVILIGAFANEGNVKILKDKLGQEGIKVYTEPLDTPQGKKTRVRAGPFPNREAAEKALDKMKRIGVSGVIAAK